MREDIISEGPDGDPGRNAAGEVAALPAAGRDLFRRPDGELWTMGGEHSRAELIQAADSLP